MSDPSKGCGHYCFDQEACLRRQEETRQRRAAGISWLDDAKRAVVESVVEGVRALNAERPGWGREVLMRYFANKMKRKRTRGRASAARGRPEPGHLDA